MALRQRRGLPAERGVRLGRLPMSPRLARPRLRAAGRAAVRRRRVPGAGLRHAPLRRWPQRVERRGRCRHVGWQRRRRPEGHGQVSSLCRRDVAGLWAQRLVPELGHRARHGPVPARSVCAREAGALRSCWCSCARRALCVYSGAGSVGVACQRAGGCGPSHLVLVIYRGLPNARHMHRSSARSRMSRTS